MTHPDPRLPALLLLCALLALGGCAGRPVATDAPAAPPYPQTAAVGPDLDIIVVRRGDHLRLVNRTPRAYDNMELWLNRQYLRRVEHIAVGDDNRLELSTFINRYREQYPVGSFLRPDRSQPLVLAELYDRDNDLRYRLVVQPTGDLAG